MRLGAAYTAYATITLIVCADALPVVLRMVVDFSERSVQRFRVFGYEAQPKTQPHKTAPSLNVCKQKTIYTTFCSGVTFSTCGRRHRARCFVRHAWARVHIWECKSYDSCEHTLGATYTQAIFILYIYVCINVHADVARPCEHLVISSRSDTRTPTRTHTSAMTLNIEHASSGCNTI